MGQQRKLTRNEKRRLKKKAEKQLKKLEEKKLSNKMVEEETGNGKNNESTLNKPVVYSSEPLELLGDDADPLLAEFSNVIERFTVKKEDESEAKVDKEVDSGKEIERKLEEEASKVPKLSRKQRKLQNRLTVAQLKRFDE